MERKRDVIARDVVRIDLQEEQQRKARAGGRATKVVSSGSERIQDKRATEIGTERNRDEDRVKSKRPLRGEGRESLEAKGDGDQDAPEQADWPRHASGLDFRVTTVIT